METEKAWPLAKDEYRVGSLTLKRMLNSVMVTLQSLQENTHTHHIGGDHDIGRGH